MLPTLQFGVVNSVGTRLTDRWWDEIRMRERAEKEPDTIIFLPECWANFIGQMTYKPGAEIDYDYDINYSSDRIYIIMLVPDVCDPEKMTRVGQTFYLPPWEEITKSFDYGPHQLVRNCVRELEMHEVDEWLLFDGEKVFDPHARDKEKT